MRDEVEHAGDVVANIRRPGGADFVAPGAPRILRILRKARRSNEPSDACGLNGFAAVRSAAAAS
jgi:hypothetical protein